MSPVSIVVATRNRETELLATLERVVRLAEGPQVIVVDNASSDATPRAVRAHFPGVEVVRLPANTGAAARNAGVRHAAHEVVAFCDDDSWWDDGALAVAERRFEAHPRLGLLAARVVVEPAGTTDPTCEQMAGSPLRAAVVGPAGPYPGVVGFLACGAVVRRQAFLAVGGFRRELVIGGEESLVAYDMAAQGWERCYADDVVARHRPSPSRDPGGRRRLETRNALWTLWARRPLGVAARRSAALVGATRTRAVALGLWDACRGMSWAAAQRAPLPGHVESALQAVERAS